MSRIPGIDALDGGDLTRAAQVGRQQVKSVVAFLRERVPGFEKAILGGIAERVGVRETRRIAVEALVVTGRAISATREANDIGHSGGSVAEFFVNSEYYRPPFVVCGPC